MKQFIINIPETTPVASLVNYISFAVHHYQDYLYYRDLNEYGDDKADENLEINNELTQLVMDAVFTNEEWLTASNLSIQVFGDDENLTPRQEMEQSVAKFLISKKALIDMADQEEHIANNIKENYEKNHS